MFNSKLLDFLAKRAAPVVVTALLVAACVTNTRQQTDVQIEPQYERLAHAVSAQQSNAPKSGGANSGAQPASYSFDILGAKELLCRIRGECVDRCIDHVSDAVRNKLPAAIDTVRKFGTKALEKSISEQLIQFEALPKTHWLWHASPEKKLRREQLVFDAIVLSHVIGSGGTAGQRDLIERISKSCRCEW
jgi:hypothetical protein